MEKRMRKLIYLITLIMIFTLIGCSGVIGQGAASEEDISLDIDIVEDNNDETFDSNTNTINTFIENPMDIIPDYEVPKIKRFL